MSLGAELDAACAYLHKAVDALEIITRVRIRIGKKDYDKRALDVHYLDLIRHHFEIKRTQLFVIGHFAAHPDELRDPVALELFRRMPAGDQRFQPLVQAVLARHVRSAADAETYAEAEAHVAVVKQILVYSQADEELQKAVITPLDRFLKALEPPSAVRQAAAPETSARVLSLPRSRRYERHSGWNGTFGAKLREAGVAR